MISCYKLFLLVLFFILMPVHAQAGDSEDFKLWVDAGIGSYDVSPEINGFSVNLGVNRVKNGTLIKIRSIFMAEFNVLGPEPLENYLSVGLLMGKGFSGKHTQIYFSGGIGIMRGIQRGDTLVGGPITEGFLFDNTRFEKESFFTPSIPLEMHFIFKPVKFLGAGLSIWFDANPKKSTMGTNLNLAFGKLR